MSAESLAFLSEAGRVLGETLDLPATFARVARLCVPTLAEVALVDLIEPGQAVRRVAAAAADPAKDALAQELLRYPPRSGTHPALEAIRGGSPSLLSTVPDEKLRAVAQDERHLALMRELKFVSVLEVPLIARGAGVGVLSLARCTPDAYSARDVALAEELARRAAVAVDNGRLFVAEQRARLRAEEAALRTLKLLSVTEGLEGALEPAEVAKVILQRGLVEAGASAAAVALIEGGELRVLAHQGFDVEKLKGLFRIPLDKQVPLAHAARTGEVVLLPRLQDWAARFAHAPAQPGEHRSWVALPLSIAGRTIGAMSVSYRDERAFGVDEAGFLIGLASQCAQALHRAQLFAAEHAARAAAEEAVRAREEFLSIASHELRTPLTPLVLQLGILRKAVDPSLAKRVETAQRQTERLSRLVDNLLDVSRIGLGAMQLQRDEVDLEGLVRGCVERFAEEAKRQACTLSLETEPLRINADALRVEQVLTNLLTNALKYGATTAVSIRLWTEQGAACFSVSDGGIGIAQRDHERIFGRFERAASAREFGGLGLGLYISRQIVQAHGGVISVHSAPGEGASFVVRLPLQA